MQPKAEPQYPPIQAIGKLPPMMEVRLRGKIPKDEMVQKVGKLVQDDAYNLLITRNVRVLMPDGRPLCTYLPAAIPTDMREASYPILTTIRGLTNNRGLASASKRVTRYPGSRNTEVAPVASNILGHIERAGGRHLMCRTTAWTGRNTHAFSQLYPYFRIVGDLFRTYVPDRWLNQMRRVIETEPDYVIPETPFTTVTVNNSFATGVHQDAGDLDEGYSCLTVLRKGEYTGGRLVFPEWRVAVDMQDGDVLLMDAHQWHGNTDLVKQSDDAERISVVLYFRSLMTTCKAPEAELQLAQERANMGMLDGIGG